jgi:hypothetical protein
VAAGADAVGETGVLAGASGWAGVSAVPERSTRVITERGHAACPS